MFTQIVENNFHTLIMGRVKMGRASRGCVLWRWCVVWALKSDQGDLIGSGCKNQLLTTMTEREIRGRVVFGKLGFSKFLIFILNQHIEIASVEYFDNFNEVSVN